jgi:GNAT superfamily N-acetyltransferase
VALATVIDVEPATITIVDADSALARSAMAKYFTELAQRFPDGFEPGDALDEAALSFNPPGGVFVIAQWEDQAVGCGAAQFLDADTAEIKRMWVSPGWRGRGLGQGLLTFLEREARQAGCGRVVLDTNGALSEAINMYRSRGYVEIERYNDNPYAHHWFAKDVAAAGEERA